MQPGRLVVLFDADCGICAATAAWLRRRDRAGRLELVPLQAARDPGRPLLSSVAAGHDLHGELHVVDETSGQIRAGGAALTAIIGRLPGGAAAARLGGFPAIAWLVGLGYAFVARNRHAIGRALRMERSCRVLEPRA